MVDTIIYCFGNVIKRNANPDGTLEIKRLYKLFSYFLHLPKEYRWKMLKELEDKKIIKRINKSIIKVNHC